MMRFAGLFAMACLVACTGESDDTTSAGSDTASTSGTGTESATASASGSTGGSGSSTGSSTGSAVVDFDEQIQPLLNANCLCHMQDPEGMMEADYLTMNPGMAQMNLIDVDAMGAPSIKRVTPGDRAASYLWHKLNGTHTGVGGVGDSMPPLGPLEDGEIELIGQWIDGL